LTPERLDSHIAYDLQPRAERFYVHVPHSYSSEAHYGLIVYIDPGNQIDAEPPGWTDVLDRRKLLFIAPHDAGNAQGVRRRLGLAVLAALASLSKVLTKSSMSSGLRYSRGSSSADEGSCAGLPLIARLGSTLRATRVGGADRNQTDLAGGMFQ
jgi:hypothetical protein